LIDFPYLPQLLRQRDNKILMLVLSGIAGPPDPTYGRSELDAARVPTLDNLSRQSVSGLAIPIAPGITPGSVPSNLALLGYDPLKYTAARGALEAMGTGLEIGPGDIAARGNFATLGTDGLIADRRAQRLTTEQAAPLVERLRQIEVPGVEIAIGHTSGYRFAIRLRGEGLDPAVSATDPIEDGAAPTEAEARTPAAAKAAEAANAFVIAAKAALDGETSPNTVLLRGWGGPPDLPSFPDAYGLRPAAITAYPIYQGLAESVGMTVHRTGPSFADHLAAIREHWDNHDFIWVHYKEPDFAAQDGDFNGKRRVIERLDEHVHDVLALGVDILVIAGDHANPSGRSTHSWHPVPFMIKSAETVGETAVDRFNERDLRAGALGQFESKHAMMYILAHAGRLGQFGE
jgi:2,3-bisphosphoglycerate-independent phosphoglycerate mutase